MHIREATDHDRGDIRRVHLSAFPEGESEVISELAVNLLSEDTTPPTLSLVAEADATLVGHVAFSPVTIGDRANFRGYILAPLAVRPAYQRCGIGSRLVERGLGRLSEMGVGIVFVYGDPAYYSRFGFSAEAAARYTPPYGLQYPFGWQGIALKESRADHSPVEIACVAALCDPVLW
jgi:putative acetyltransferase